MKASMTAKTGCTSHADLIDLLAQNSLSFNPELVKALGYEVDPSRILNTDDKKGSAGANPAFDHPTESADPGWTQFQPTPSQYWRVTGYEAVAQEPSQKNRRKKGAFSSAFSSAFDSDAIAKLPEPEEIRKEFGFSVDQMLPREPLAATNYVTTQLRRAAGAGRSRHELDLTAAVDRLSRGQFLFHMPKRARRVWGHELLCLEDRAERLIPYWSDQDDVTTALSRLYPDTGFTVARLPPGRGTLRIQQPEALHGHECALPAAGTLVLALSDLGALATNAEDQRFKEFWIDLGRSYRENGNRAVALVPCLAEQIPDDVAKYWHIIPWERAATQSGGHNSEAIDTLLTLLSVAVRLEPELLRSIRKLLPETRDNPGIESLVWQSTLVASPNCIAADLDATERKKWISEFAHQESALRRAVLDRLRAVRQIGYEDVWVSELLGLDADSQTLVRPQDVVLAEQQILSLASRGEQASMDDDACWLERLDDQLTEMPHMKKEVRDALARLVKRVRDPNVERVSAWMPAAVEKNPDAPEQIVQILQQGSQLRLEKSSTVPDSETSGQRSPWGSLIGQIRSRSQEFRFHESDRVELSERGFWQSGRKPAWVQRFNTDEYGAWCLFQIKAVEQVLRWVPAGTFLMGSPDTEEGRFDDEGPQHQVTISRGFWMFETQCTQQLWTAVMENNPSRFPGYQRPVEQVSWNDSVSFIEKLNGLLPGIGVRLPAEAQWEYACRGPGESRRHSRYGELDQIAWYAQNSVQETHDVRQKAANCYGLYDMLGNVYEWCQDHAFRKYDRKPQTDPLYEQREYEQRDAVSNRVIRGGSWINNARLVRSACRGWYAPGSRSINLGFRLLSSPEPGAEPSREAARSGSESQRGGGPQDRDRGSPHRGKNLKKGPRSRMLTWKNDDRGRSIAISKTRALRIETDCEILSLEFATPPEWAAASGRDGFGLWAEFELNGVRQRLRWIPPGQFLMGSKRKPEWSYLDEQPQHPVTITHGFWMFDTPCTQQLWEAAGLRNESSFKGSLRPAENLSFTQAGEFIAMVNRQVAGLKLRLSTEAEWEYSCRAGTVSDRYGNLDKIAWYDKNSGGETHDVKLKLPNAWGLYDMLGNVWEWCLDGPRRYLTSPEVDPVGDLGSYRVIRGGSWFNNARYVRSACRSWDDPGSRYDHLGFRLLSSHEPSPVQGREVAISESESLRGSSPQDRERELPHRGEKKKKKK